MRDEGTPYIEHITGVIDILRQHNKTSDYVFTIAALHDILEDTDTTKDEIYTLLYNPPDEETIKEFRKIHKCNDSKAEEIYESLNNKDVLDIVANVELLTHNEADSFKDYTDRIFQYNSINRMKYSYNGAARVKLADRLHNLQSLPLCNNQKKIERKVKETIECIMPWRKKNNDCKSLFAAIEKQLDYLIERYNLPAWDKEAKRVPQQVTKPPDTVKKPEKPGSSCCLFSYKSAKEAMSSVPGLPFTEVAHFGGTGEGYSWSDGSKKLCKCKNCGALFVNYRITFLEMAYDSGELTYSYYFPVANREEASKFIEKYIGTYGISDSYKGKKIWFNPQQLSWCWDK